HYSILEKLRPGQLLVVASVGYAYLNPRFLTRVNVFRFWPTKLVLALAFLACASAPFGISLGSSGLFIINNYAKTLAYAFLLALAIRHVRDLFTFVWAYVVACGILAYFSIFVFGITKQGHGFVTRLNNLDTYDSNDLCVVLMVGLPLTLLLLSVSRGVKRWLLLLIFIGISITMARSGSRGGFLGFLAVGASALFIVNTISTSRKVLMLSAAAIALALGAPPGYWQQMGTILSPKDDYNYTDSDGRKAVMQRGIGYMNDYPVFGLGMDNFSKAECTISPKISPSRLYGPLRCTPPHNSYLQAGAELGYPGLLIWGSLVFAGILVPLRIRRRLPRSMLQGTEVERFTYAATGFFALSMIGFAVTSFFVSFAWMDPVYFMAAMLAGLYVTLDTEFRFALGDRKPIEGWRVIRSRMLMGEGAAKS
ncbi:MAG TPA: O-antigen ligase family protein, partial [Terriglobales bacterium]|nr:O-antigen ligase family protein [Terriglobales bacterium]